MLVRCPKCQTTYKVADDLLKGGSPAFRCSRCKHTFELEGHGSPEASTGATAPSEPQATAAPASGQELRLPFENPPKPAASEIDNKESAQDFPATDDFSADLGRDDQWSLTEPDRQNEAEEFKLPDHDQALAVGKVGDKADDFVVDEPFFAKAESAERTEDLSNILAISSYREQKVSILPFVTLFAILVIGFSFFSVVSYAKPQTAESIIRQIPIVGSAVLRNNYLKHGILITSLHSSYQTIQGHREVLLISGVALNQNPEVVREIQLTGIAYNEQGKEIERQTIWVGNTISPKILRGMTLEDIPHLQDLKPLKSFEIPPGDSIPFTIVFLKSAKNAREFSCEVVRAEGAV